MKRQIHERETENEKLTKTHFSRSNECEAQEMHSDYKKRFRMEGNETKINKQKEKSFHSVVFFSSLFSFILLSILVPVSLYLERIVTTNKNTCFSWNTGTFPREREKIRPKTLSFSFFTAQALSSVQMKMITGQCSTNSFQHSRWCTAHSSINIHLIVGSHPKGWFRVWFCYLLFVC